MSKRPKILIIMNPKSGLMQAPKYLSEIIDFYTASGYMSSVLMTQGAADAREYAKEYAGDFDIIVVSGGDGTLNEVIDGVIKSGASPSLGYLPSGSTNDFATSLGIPKGVMEAARRVIRGQAQELDVGSFNGRYFSYIASFGAFTSTSYSVPQNLKNILGHTAYVLGGIKDVVNIKSIHARINSSMSGQDERISEGEYIFGAICNTTSVAGILKLDNYDVKMDDGLLEVLLVKTPKNLDQLRDIIVNMLAGRLESEQIEFYNASNISINIDSGTHWTLDGEYEEGSSLINACVVPRAIKLIV